MMLVGESKTVFQDRVHQQNTIYILTYLMILAFYDDNFTSLAPSDFRKYQSVLNTMPRSTRRYQINYSWLLEKISSDKVRRI